MSSLDDGPLLQPKDGMDATGEDLTVLECGNDSQTDGGQAQEKVENESVDDWEEEFVECNDTCEVETVRQRKATPKRVTFAENLPTNSDFKAIQVVAEPIELQEPPGDSTDFFDVPESCVVPFLLKQLFSVKILIFAIQLLFSGMDLSTDAYKGIEVDRSNLSYCDVLLRRLFGGYARWDSVHFLHVANHGYLWEQSLAFFPLLPLLIRYGSLWAYPLIQLGVLHPTTVHILTGVFLNMICSTLTCFALYRIVMTMTGSVKQSMLACIVFSVNPASVFFNVIYSESLYSALTFWGIAVLIDNELPSNLRFIASQVCFALAFSTRSNGFLNLGYVGWYCMLSFLFKKGDDGKWYSIFDKTAASVAIYLASSFVKCVLALTIVTYPLQMHSRLQHSRFCTNDVSMSVSPDVASFAANEGFVIAGDRNNVDWCGSNSFFFPPWYSSIQAKYWDVGLFGYWQLKKIPCFLMATPAFLLLLLGLKVAKGQFKDHKHLDPYILDRACLLPFAIHSIVIAFGALFVYNAEVFTRVFFSSTPFPYLILAKWMSGWTPKARLSDVMQPFGLPFLYHFSRKGWKECLIMIYFVNYLVTGTAWHSCWLPFT